jgi:ribosomal protein S18 acetylase RimI-like enzyme
VSGTDPVVIRRAAPADAARLAELSGELGYPAAAETLAGRLSRLLARPADVVLVAEVAGEVAGWIHGSEQHFLESGSRCELLGLVVDAQHRGQGVGRRLVAAVEAWASGRGLDLVAVRSNVAFYERLGYARVKTQHAYRKRLDDRG